MSNRALVLSLLAALTFALGACSSESDHGHAHDEGGEHSHDDGASHDDHGRADEQQAPETKAFYGEDRDAADESTSEHSHSHADEDEGHSH